MTTKKTHRDPPANPYVGPRPFDTGEPIFGRERELRELACLLGAERIVLLHAPSGAGKSSLIQAGVIPRMRERFDVWRPTRVGHPLPADVPADRNRHTLSAVMGFEQGIPEHLRRTGPALAGLRLAEYVSTRPRRPSAPENTLLIFDQFEEVLTADPLAIAAKRDFFAQLGELLQDPRIWALFSLREDYLAPLDPYAQQVPTHLRNRYRIDLLGLDAAREAIVRPASRRGRMWTEPALDRLIHDLAAVKLQVADGRFIEATGIHVEPLQLQVVCRGLWERMPTEDLCVEAEDVETFGDVTHALGDYYAAEVRQIAAGDERSERGLRQWVGEKLITAEGIRSPVLRSAGASEGLANERIAGLVDAHLVRAEHRGGALWYELAHDRLVGPVREDNARWAQAKLQPVQVQAALWARQGRPAGLLLSEEALIEAERWVAGQAEPPGEPDRSFLAASRTARAQERAIREAQAGALRAAQELAETQAQAAARQRRFTWLVGLMGLLAATAAAVSFWAYREAGEQAARAEDATMRARDQSRMVAVRGAATDPTIQAVILREVERPAQTHLWLQAAITARQSPAAQAVFEHDHGVTSAVPSPDGRRVVTTASDGTARLWQADGLESVELAGHTDAILSAVFSPDGGLVVTASMDETARVWRADGAGPALMLAGHAGAIVSAAFSPDGSRVVTASDDETARVWRADGTGEPVVLAGHASHLLSAAFSPDGARVVTASNDRTARVWRSDGSGEPLVLRGHTDTVWSAIFSPDGSQVVTASQDRTARVWRADGTGEPLVLTGHAGTVWSAGFSSDGERVVTASQDRTARVWRVDGREEPLVLDAHAGAVVSAMFSPDGLRVVTASEDATARVWRADGSGEPLVLLGHASGVVSAHFSGDGIRVVTASRDETARVWRVVGGGEPVVLAGWIGAGTPAVFSPDGSRLVIAADDRTARVWRIDGMGEPLAWTGHGATVTAAVFSPDGSRVATASDDRTARVWRVDGAGVPLVVTGPRSITSVVFSPDGSRVATTSEDRTARVWRVDGAGVPMALTGHTDTVGSAAFSPDGGRVVTSSWDATARVWRVDGAGVPLVLAGHQDAVNSAMFSPDGTRVVTASDDTTARVWRADGAGVPLVLTGHTGVVVSAMFSSDGSRVVTASEDRTARVWRVDGGGEPLVLTGHANSVVSAMFSPDGRRVVTASQDGTARVWQADGSGEALVLAGHRGRVRAAVFSPDGGKVVTSSDQAVRVWTLRSPDEHVADLWRATPYCLPEDQRIHRLGETREEARIHLAACTVRVREHAAQGTAP